MRGACPPPASWRVSHLISHHMLQLIKNFSRYWWFHLGCPLVAPTTRRRCIVRRFRTESLHSSVCAAMRILRARFSTNLSPGWYTSPAVTPAINVFALRTLLFSDNDSFHRRIFLLNREREPKNVTNTRLARNYVNHYVLYYANYRA